MILYQIVIVRQTYLPLGQNGVHGQAADLIIVEYRVKLFIVTNRVRNIQFSIICKQILGQMVRTRDCTPGKKEDEETGEVDEVPCDGRGSESRGKTI